MQLLLAIAGKLLGHTPGAPPEVEANADAEAEFAFLTAEGTEGRVRTPGEAERYAQRWTNGQ